MKVVQLAVLAVSFLALTVIGARHSGVSVARTMRAIDRVLPAGHHSRERFLGVAQLPYPYYQRPKYRYPFYDEYGNGHLVYGYGDHRLYKYKNFKPLDGYSKKR